MTSHEGKGNSVSGWPQLVLSLPSDGAGTDTVDMMDVERAGSTGTHPGLERRRVRAGRLPLAGLLLTVLAVLAPLLTASPAAAETPAPTTSPNATSRVVFLGIAGLSWPDITAKGTPALFEMAGS